MIKTVTLSPGEEGGERGRGERKGRRGRKKLKAFYHIKSYISVSIVLWIIIHSKCGR